MATEATVSREYRVGYEPYSGVRIRWWASKTKEMGSAVRSTPTMLKMGAREMLVISNSLLSEVQSVISQG